MSAVTGCTRDLHGLAALCTVLLIVCGLFPQAAAAQNPASTTCARLGAPYEQVSLLEVEGAVLPAKADVPCSEVCTAQVGARVAQFRAQDMGNFAELANRVCSYRLGWVEKVPGTCRAGGPPPLCPVDHWKKVDLTTAFASYKVEAEAVKKARREELDLIACSCKMAELKASDAPPSAPRHAVTKRTPADVYEYPAVPCSNNMCSIPGTSCREGLCVPDTPLQHAESQASDRVRDYVAGEVTDKLEKKVIGALSETLLKMAENETLAMAGGVLQATDISPDRALYDEELRSVMQDTKNLRRLYQEYIDCQNGAPARAPQQIQTDIDQVKREFSEHIEQLNLAYNAVVRQHDLRSSECYQVFEYQLQRINQTYANFTALH